MLGITVGNGQVCVAGSRIYVQDTVYKKFLGDFTKMAKDAALGDPLLMDTTKGVIANKSQRDRVFSYVQKGKDSGAKLLFGGEKMDGDRYHIQNTAFTDASHQASIMQEEVFGPLAPIAPFSTEEDVTQKANDTSYGLRAQVLTNDINKAFSISEEFESGMVMVNAWGILSANTPFGGVKQSGFGRDQGREALHNWTVLKTVKWNILAKK